jgi:hypothetical protein
MPTDPVNPKEETMNGAELITAERQRQVEVEGYSAEHDREHGSRSLEAAALAYFRCADGSAEMPPDWPWAPQWWKPKDRMRNLIRAGALLQAAGEVSTLMVDGARCFGMRDMVAAEIDRLQACG